VKTGNIVTKLLLGFIALASLGGSILLAQDSQITGTWQGRLKEGSRELRVVFTISIENDRLTAVNYVLDDGGNPIPVSTISRNGSTIKLTIPDLSATFEGRLSPDGNTISGTYTRLDPTSLTLVRATKDNAWLIPQAEPPPRLMPADAVPEFEVATIKPSRQDERFAILLYPGGTFAATSASLGDLIRFAYDVHPRQISGGPGWLDSDKYDITAKPDIPGTPSARQSKMMMRKLLADRFGLEFHREQKEMSVYAITLMQGPPKVTASSGGADLIASFRTASNRIAATNSTIAEFAEIMQANILDQPVLDRTGLGSARYAFTLKWTPDQSTSQPDDDAPDLFTAFQQQLGLRLQPTKALADVLVIDRAEKPSAN
jgi:uncharacterized protein (TIGR03435 family)